MEKFEEIACKQCQLLLRENGILKRGRDVQRLKIREQAEELQNQEENQMHSNLCDSDRDERDMVIADELSKCLHSATAFGDMVILNKIIKQLRGE